MKVFVFGEIELILDILNALNSFGEKAISDDVSAALQNDACFVLINDNKTTDDDKIDVVRIMMMMMMM